MTVEAAPERTGIRKAVRAERPVAKVEPQAKEVIPEPAQVTGPIAEVIPLPVAKQVEEKLEDGMPGTPPDGASGVVIPAMYQERGPVHARQVTKRRQANGAQLRLF